MPIAWLALLLLPVLLGDRRLLLAALAAWGAAALIAWLGLPGVPWRLLGPLVAYAALVVLAPGDAGWVGGALAPLVMLLLVGRLPGRATAPAAAAWALSVAAVGWVVAGVLGLAGLQSLPGPLSSAALPVVGALLAYAAGRRAALIQGLADRVAHGVGLTLAVGGSVVLAGPGGALPTVFGVGVGLLLASVAPAPPPAARPALAALAGVHQQLVFAAPLSYAALWLVHTFS